MADEKEKQKDPAEEIKCIVCGKPGTKKCGDCGAVAYCSPECQQKHWKTHRHWCKKIRAIFAKLEETIYEESRTSCVGMPKRKKEKAKRGVAASPEPGSKRTRLALEEAANDLAVIPPDQRSPGLVIENLARAGVVVPRADWRMQKALLAGLLFGRPSETVLSGRTLAPDVLKRIIELASKRSAMVGVFNTDSRSLQFRDLLSDAEPTHEIDVAAVQDRVGLSDVKLREESSLAMVGRDTIALGRDFDFCVAKLNPDGSVLRHVTVKKRMETAFVYVPKLRKFAVISDLGAITFVDAATLATEVIKFGVSGNSPDELVLFADRMLCVVPSNRGEKILVLGPSNGWKSPLYTFETRHFYHRGLSFCNTMILTEEGGRETVTTHYLTRDTDAFASVAYDNKETSQWIRDLSDNVTSHLSAGMLVWTGVAADGKAIYFGAVAPPETLPMARDLSMQKFRYDFPKRFRGKYELLKVRSQCAPPMDNVMVYCPSWEEKLIVSDEQIFWLTRKPSGEVKYTVTTVPISEGDRPAVQQAYGLSTNPNVVVLIEYYSWSSIRRAHVVDVDTGIVLKTVELGHGEVRLAPAFPSLQ